MRVLPVIMAAAIGTFATAAFAQQQQTGPGSNQPPGQANTTQSSEQRLDNAGGKAAMGKKASKKHAKKVKKNM